MRTSAAARRYARALFGLADETGAIAQIRGELAQIAALFESDLGLRNALFRRVELAALRRWDLLAELDGESGWDAEAWRTCGSDLMGFTQGRLDPVEVVRTCGVLRQVQDGIPSFVWKDAGGTGLGYSPAP